MSLNQLRNSRCYTKYRMKNLNNSYIKLQQSCKQHKLWLKPDSILHYSSSRRQPFNCMLSIMEYSSKLNMRLLSPSNTRYCIVRKVKNCYKVNTVLILLNMRCKQLLKTDSTRNYRLNKRQPFNCMLSIMECSNKINMRLLSPGNTRYCMKYKLLSSDCMCYNL